MHLVLFFLNVFGCGVFNVKIGPVDRFFHFDFRLDVCRYLNLPMIIFVFDFFFFQPLGS